MATEVEAPTEETPYHQKTAVVGKDTALHSLHCFAIIPEIPLFPASFPRFTPWWTGEERVLSRASIDFPLNRLLGFSSEKGEKGTPDPAKGSEGRGRGRNYHKRPAQKRRTRTPTPERFAPKLCAER
ncbi:hypothetical protein AKJ37_06850 [candidate division MSBL1 archaeon SCGC-AAA259I09]|uniref:Uncharacterized protein n=1 Tax=candidate division MSBL1 archaeon SCGC-AAA259I09 TaxID=1698267 RepID=A0A133UMQ0_9EURY|nr:hypothetical protein AKJ37_06850 [candidate division MSBL1 archaeon SCGC-AAA259I09]